MEYRLEALLDLRKRERDERERAVAAAIEESARNQAELATRHDELADLRRAAGESARRSASAAGSAGELAAAARYARRAALDERGAIEAIHAAEAQLRAAEEGVGAARDALADAMRALDAVEKHQEGWEDARRREADRRAQTAADDLASRRKP